MDPAFCRLRDPPGYAIMAAVPRYWITTQWPPLKGRQDWEPGVYLAKGLEPAGADLEVGDWVLVYEFKSGPTEILGAGGRKPRRPGRQAVIAIARVAKPLRARRRGTTRYVGRTPITWTRFAAFDRDERGRPVPLKKVLKALGFKSGGCLRGIGKKSSGLKEITKTQFDTLRRHFKRAA